MASLLQDALIVELGTMHGGSAIALAAGSRKNRVVTYNIVDDLTPNMRACGMRPDAFLAALEEENLSIEWRFENVLGSEERMRELLEASLIHIDINHHGDIEDAILQFLVGNGYEGLVVLDDIYLNENMDRVWGSVWDGVCKHDLTDYGHTVAGTGLLDFSCRVLIT
mmetsp:Transcript_25201/g.83188  ORF Transcript_25201/g.83188 Transcript_25201/m.83188 type:complete len:167 (-) Transcript_25201:883-1383(-)